jgi:hypothetical protein
MPQSSAHWLLTTDYWLLTSAFDIIWKEADTSMTIQKRSAVIATIAFTALVFWGVSKYYAPRLVLHVVEQSLVQKAPPEADPTGIQQRLQNYLSTAPDQKAQMEQLLRISAYLEKVQRLTPQELDELLAAQKPDYAPGL